MAQRPVSGPPDHRTGRGFSCKKAESRADGGCLTRNKPPGREVPGPTASEAICCWRNSCGTPADSTALRSVLEGQGRKKSNGGRCHPPQLLTTLSRSVCSAMSMPCDSSSLRKDHGRQSKPRDSSVKQFSPIDFENRCEHFPVRGRDTSHVHARLQRARVIRHAARTPQSVLISHTVTSEGRRQLGPPPGRTQISKDQMPVRPVHVAACRLATIAAGRRRRLTECQLHHGDTQAGVHSAACSLPKLRRIHPMETDVPPDSVQEPQQC